MKDNLRDGEPLLDALTAFLPALLTSLEALGHVARYLHPPHLEALIAEVDGVADTLISARPAIDAVSWPPDLRPVHDRLLASADHAIRAFQDLAAARASANPVLAAYRALRHLSRALDALYPVSALLPPVGRFFLSADMRDDTARIDALARGRFRGETGIIEAGNARHERGGFSLYVPEDYDLAHAYPLIVALHGGSGHGREFLWTWLSDARSRGVILLSPTACGDTWSLMGDDPDTPNIEAMLMHVQGRWNVNPRRLLVTGMSDGGTFAYVTGLRAQSPFTHLAPVSAAFHPMLAEMADARRVSRLPVYVTHGMLDWMFPVAFAEAAEAALRARGAETVLDAIPDLSHTYPREANRRILDWFLQGDPAGADPSAGRSQRGAAKGEAPETK